MFEEAVEYPYDGGEGLRAIAIGSVLTMLGVLVLPLVLVSGYTVRVIRTVAAGDTHPPAWDDWGSLFVDGLKAIAVGIGYLLVPTALVGLAVVAFFVPVSEPVPRVLSLVLSVVALLSVPLLLAALYALPAGLAAFAVSGSLGAAFAVRRLWPVLRSGTYAVAWLLAFVVTVVAGAVGGLLGGLTPAGLAVVEVVLAAVVAYYANVVVAYLYARGFTGGRPVVTTGDENGEPSPAI